MTEWNDETLSFSRCRRRRVWADFLGVSISSNGAMLLLREMERRLGLVKRVARSLGEARQRGKVRHEVVTMLRQRVLALALGYEDLNDHDTLRDGLVVQTACEGARRLASSSTLCRFERRAERQWAIAIHHPRGHVRTDCRVKPGRDRLLARAPALRTRRLAPTVVAHRAFRNPQQPSDVAVRTLSACRAAKTHPALPASLTAIGLRWRANDAGASLLFFASGLRSRRCARGRCGSRWLRSLVRHDSRFTSGFLTPTKAPLPSFSATSWSKLATGSVLPVELVKGRVAYLVKNGVNMDNSSKGPYLAFGRPSEHPIQRFSGSRGAERVVESLKSQMLFQGNEDAAHRVLEAGELQAFNIGETLITEGEWSNDIFFFLAGASTIKVGGSDVAARTAGQYVGEMALIDSSKSRSATVVAIEETVALVVPEKDFSAVADTYPYIWRELANQLADRLRQRNRFVRTTNKTPKLFVACSTESIDLAESIRHELKDKLLEIILWTEGVFKPSNHTMEDLEATLDSVDFALAIFSADDDVVSRGTTGAAPRDNTIFELGLFAGRIGRQRSFFLWNRDIAIKVPSDLYGVTALTCSSSRSHSGGWDVIDACRDMWNRIAELGPR